MGHHERRAAVRRYLAAMDAGNYEAAGALFAAGAQYQRPMITDSGNAPVMQLIAGRQAILDSWEKRGARNIAHEVRTIAEFGDHVFAEGVATLDGDRLLAFMTYVTFDGDGLFSQVVAHSALLPTGAEPGRARDGD
jgi:ketosteroid isomerase-like protein